jgi:hypothetical protein
VLQVGIAFGAKSDRIKKVLTDRVKKQRRFVSINELSPRVYQNPVIDLKDALCRYRSFWQM